MAFFQSFLAKSTGDIVRAAKSAFVQLNSEENDEKTLPKIQERIASNLKELKSIFYGDAERESKSQSVIDKTVVEIVENDLPRYLIKDMAYVDFDSRKDIVTILCFLFRQEVQPNPLVEYLEANIGILKKLCEGYDNPVVALNCGALLRDGLKHEVLCKIVLEHEEILYPFFKYVQKPAFDVASDAFSTFKMILTLHKKLAARVLEEEYDKFFGAYNNLIQSTNYVSMRQSIKLLGEILLDRKNFNIMIKYINDAENLKIMMILLRGRSKTIQFEAFHVFKVFVANPDKSAPVNEILLRNKSKLIEFLSEFQEDKDEDEQFAEEKNILLTTLSRLE